MRAEEGRGGKVHGVAQQAGQLVLDPEETQSHGGTWLKLDEQVDVGLPASVAMEARTEQSQPPDAVAATQVLKSVLVEFQASENHRKNASTLKAAGGRGVWQRQPDGGAGGASGVSLQEPGNRSASGAAGGGHRR